MKTAKIVFAAWLMLIAAASAFAQTPSANVNTQQLTLLPQVPITVNGISGSSSVQGSTTYFYWIVAHVGGEVSAPQGPAVIANGSATLSGSSFNTIQWNQSSGATSYDVLRSSSSATPTGTCNCAVITGTGKLSALDQSNSLLSYSVLTSADQVSLICLNTTGCSTGTPCSITGITAGSVLFVNSTGQCAGNQAALGWDNILDVLNVPNATTFGFACSGFTEVQCLSNTRDTLNLQMAAGIGWYDLISSQRSVFTTPDELKLRWTTSAADSPLDVTLISEAATVTPGDLAVFAPNGSTTGALADGGPFPTPIPANLTDNYTVLGSNIPLMASTLTTVLTQTLTMPASGCPCRVRLDYGINWLTGSNNSSGDAAVTDGNFLFATSQQHWAATSNSGGQRGGQLTYTSYNNSQVVTFTLEVETNQSGNAIEAAPLLFGQNTFFSANVQTSVVDGWDKTLTQSKLLTQTFNIGPLAPSTQNEKPVAFIVGDAGLGVPTIAAGALASTFCSMTSNGGVILTTPIGTSVTVNSNVTSANPVNVAGILTLFNLSGTFACVQATGATTITSNPQTATFGSSNTAGDEIIALVSCDDAPSSNTSIVVTDSQGNVYQAIGTIYLPSTAGHVPVQVTAFLATHIAGGSAATVTFHFSQALGTGTVQAQEVSGIS